MTVANTAPPRKVGNWEACLNFERGCRYVRNSSGGVNHNCKYKSSSAQPSLQAVLKSRKIGPYAINRLRSFQAQMIVDAAVSPLLVTRSSYKDFVHQLVQFGSEYGYQKSNVERLLPSYNTIWSDIEEVNKNMKQQVQNDLILAKKKSILSFTTDSATDKTLGRS